jgi:hypothetical protein
MEIAEAVLAGQGHGPGRLRLGRGERLGVQLGPLDDPDARQLRDPRAMPACRRAEQDGHPLAVVDRQLLDDPVGERVVPAHDQVVPVLIKAAGTWGTA